MISHKSISHNHSPRSEDSPNPLWRPPRAPLPPHRLAKLANALGVSTPIPASSSLSRSVSESLSPVDPYRRSPTPSTVPSTPPTSGVSKFLLHVLPPLTFPCQSDCPDDGLGQPPSTASGYHTQFRRGILVPVYSNFQSLLSAIAKEYALPSTAGLTLYLLTSASSSQPSDISPTSTASVEVPDEPGPRLSEDIWRHIWTRVIQVEQRDDITPTPGLLRLKAGLASRSTPHLLGTTPLRSLTPTSGPDISHLNTTSPSTPSTASESPSHTKSVARSSVDDQETSDTSVPPNSFDLPGLRSPSLIPILAKVEFDIDRRKAVWYEPWLRNRRANFAKRIGSRIVREGSSTEGEGEVQERHPPIQLIIGRQQTASPLSDTSRVTGGGKRLAEVIQSGYHQLSEGSGENEDSNLGEEDEATAVVVRINVKDPLADVFGTDADTWADIHAVNIDRTLLNPTGVNLALTVADLSNPPDSNLQESSLQVRPEEEVHELLERMSRRGSNSTAGGVPISPTSRSSTSTQTQKKHVPPPLVLTTKGQTSDLVVPSDCSPLGSSPGSVNLAYLNGDAPPKRSPGYVNGDKLREEYDNEYSPVRSSTESEKRAGIIYDDLDLGLDPTEDYDEYDPNDRRRSQYLLKAQLDEIERTMAQLSPRMLNADFAVDGLTSASLLSSQTSNPIPHSPKPAILNADYYPPSPFPRTPSDLDRGSSSNYSSRVQGLPRSPSANATANSSQAAWPAVPFFPTPANLSRDTGNSSRIGDPPSPPRLALNGVTTSVPRPFVPPSTNTVSAETERRKRELEDEYPALTQSPSPVLDAAETPVIPLSPDPFGRYPSSHANSSIETRLSNSSIRQWDTATVGQGSIALEPVAEDVASDAMASQGRSRSATVSRFSADSVTIGEEPLASVKSSTKSGLMNVKSIRRLWRKSNSNKSISDMNGLPVPISGRHSPHAPPMRPERPSQETMDLPDVEHPLPNPPLNFKGYSPQPSPSHPLPSARVSQDQHRPSQEQYNSSRTSHDQMGTPTAHVPQSKQRVHVPNTPKQGGFPSLAVNPPPTPGLTVPQQSHPGGLGIPPFLGRNGNSSPIIAAQMLPRGGSSKDKFQFDQESPYPVHLTNPPRYSPRAVSPPSLPSVQGLLPPRSPTVPVPSTPPPPAQVQSLPSPIPEKDKPTARKSILKAFQKSKASPVPSPALTEPIDKLSQVSSITGRPRRPSFHSAKSSTTSVNDIPPSPRIPEQFLGGSGAKNGTSLVTGSAVSDSTRQPRLTASSADSAISQSQHFGRSGSPPPLSMVSSRSSQETRPSFDASQFEIVSPNHPH